MPEKEYYKELTNIIESVEINSRIRVLEDNREKLKAYFEIGRILVEAQGGAKYAKYGNNLINNWAIKLTIKYGKGYTSTNLRYFRQFFLLFKNYHTVCDRLSWSIIRLLLPIKNENARNYYINQTILNNLSVRELRNEIKNNAFDRLSYADKENIKLIETNNYNLTIEDMIKDPILIKSDKNIGELNEKVLHKYIIKMLEDKFMELGMSFTLACHEYKIKIDNHTFRIDLLFFNVKLNCYIVVEVKTMKISDCNQLMFYTKLIDKYIKEKNNNKTIGLLIAKERNNFVIKYATDNELFTSTYKLV